MNTTVFINSQIIENLGWTLLHSLWQIALVAFVLFVLLKFLRGFSANARYWISVFALVFAVSIPAFTFYQLNKTSSASFSNDEISKAKNSNTFEKPFFTPENSALQIANKTESANIKTSGFFDSVKNLQKDLSKNISFALPFLVGVWFFGILIFGFRLIGGFWQLHIFKTREISLPDKKWQSKFSALCEQLNIRQNVKLFTSNFVETPVVIGFLKPVILIPVSVFLQISPKELETIIAHELVHVRRYDALVNFAQSFVEVLFFYHPCVWWISTVIRNEREFATDEAVVKVMENSRIVYAKALANLEELRLLSNQKLTPLATAANGGNLMQRISKILQKNTGIKSRTGSLWSAVAAFAIISAFLLTVFSFNNPPVVNADDTLKNKKLAVGFVSIPTNRQSKADKSFDETPRLLIEKLNRHKVPAIGFVNGSLVTDGEKIYDQKADVIRLWRDAGLEVGIGNYKHIWFYDTPFDEYAAGVEKNAEITNRILSEKNQQVKYLSYPFLNTGKTNEDHQRFEAWLEARNLDSVKYTVDNSEWMYSWAYDLAREANDTGKMIEIRADFLKYMSEMFDHYERYSQEMFGRDINQTMVLTPSRLVADTADELFGMLEKRGYEFVSMTEAQTDNAYQTPESFTGVKAGISWFERWQMAKGKELLKEPAVSQLVENAWQNRKTSYQSKDIPPPIAAPTPPPPPPAPETPPAPSKKAKPPKPESPPNPPSPPTPPKSVI
ncbi:hypothetical protein BH20ACI4_BH20ACI4_26490 [soil metagenome]